MKRQTYRAAVVDAEGAVIAERDACAWNSAVRASEALVRDYARTAGHALEGARPSVVDPCDHGKFCHCSGSYQRVWSAPNGLEVRTVVRQVSA